MSPTNITNKSTAKAVFWAALLFTFAFVAFVFWIMRGETCPRFLLIFEECQTRWSYFKNSTPNEVGDALAGVASGLALIWIVASVVIQRLELSATVEELRIASGIEKQRDALREYQLALREFSDAFFSASSAEIMYGEWAYKPETQDHLEHVSIRTTPDRKTSDDEFNLGVACAMIVKNTSKIFANFDVLSDKPNLHLKHQQLLLSLFQLEELGDRLPYREANKLKAMKLSEARTQLGKLLSKDEFFRWKGGVK